MDDLVIAAKSTKDVKHVFDRLSIEWRIQAHPRPQDRAGPQQKVIHPTQPAYIDKLAERFPGYSIGVAKAAPRPVTRDGADQDEDEDIPIKACQELVGSLMWAAS
jgi:hypothetical protein